MINKFSKLTILMVFLAATACTDLQVAEVDSIIQETTSGAFTGSAPDLLGAVYGGMGFMADQGNLYSLNTHTSDEMIPPTRGVDWGDNGVWRTLHSHNWDPTHAQVLNTWNTLNSRIFNCNQVLAADAPAATAQEAAEAKFLRAYFMYNVMDLWGQVPDRGVNDGVDVDPTVRSASEAFDFIIADLEAAIPNLPSNGPAAVNSQASKAAAYALMTRLYLNKGIYKATGSFDAADMNKVIEYADLLTAEGYSLEDDYYDNWKTTADQEVIWTTNGANPWNRYMMTLHYNQNPSGWNGFTTLADFYDKFEDGDIRKGVDAAKDGSEFSGLGYGFLIGQQFNDDGTKIVDTRSQKDLQFTRDVPLAGAATDKGIRVMKYHPATKGEYIILRYGEAFLNKAEAVHRGGTNPGGASALDMVNTLRTKRGAAALGSLDDAAMLDERGRELYWEGTRRGDQIRFGTFANTWSEKTVTDDSRKLFPIPQQAMDSNPNLTQNDGY